MDTTHTKRGRLRWLLAALLALAMLIAAACAPPEDEEPVEEEPEEDPIQAAFVDTEITFTGDRDEWGALFDAVGMDLPFEEYGEGETGEVFTVEFAYGWDADYFYIGVLVGDEEHSHDQPADTIWEGDSLEFGIQVGDIHTKSHYALGDDGEIVWQTWEEIDVQDVSQHAVTRYDDENLTFYEVAVPWTAFEAEVGEGDVVVSSISVKKSLEGSGWLGQINLTPGLAGPTNIGQWADVALVGGGGDDEE